MAIMATRQPAAPARLSLKGSYLDAPSRIPKLSRHTHPLGEACDRRKKNGKDKPEICARGRRYPIFPELDGIPLKETADKKGHQRSGQNAHDHKLKSRRPIGPQHGEHEKKQHCCRRYGLDLDASLPRRPKGADGFRETDAVERNGNRLGKKENDADGPPELRAQGARYQIVGPTASDLQVGCNGREGHAGQDGNDARYGDDHQRLTEPRFADYVAQSPEENDPQDGEEARREDAGEGAQGFLRGRLRVFF